MKKTAPELVFIIVSVFLIVFLLNIEVETNSDVIIPGEGNTINLKDRLSWEHQRLMDPQTGRIPENIRKLELDYAKSLPSDNGFFNRSAIWVHRGPYNVGGRTRGAALDVINENIILAGGVSGGIWRSENGGASWIKVTAPDQFHSVTCLVQDKRAGKTSTWYFGTGEGYGGSASATGAYYLGDGIYRSDDNGMFWYPLASTVNNSPQSFNSSWEIVWNLALDQSNDTMDIVYAAIYGTIMRSEDGGDTWSNALNSTSGYFTDVECVSDGSVYATISSDSPKGGLWRSPDGVSWTDITPDTFPSTFDRVVMSVNPMNENSLYFLGVCQDGGQQTVTWQGDTVYHTFWKYTYLGGDGADTNGVWQDLSANLPDNGSVSFDNFYAQGSYDMVVSVKPDDSTVVFIGGTNVYRSTDAFTTKNNTTQIGGYEVGTSLPNFQIYDNHHPDQHDFFFLPSDPDVMFTASDGGMHRTDNCLAPTVIWNSLNNGYYTTQLYSVNFNYSDTSDLLIGGFQDNGNFYINDSNYDGDWVMTLNGDGSHSAIAENGNVFYQSIQNGKIYKMTIDNQGVPTGFRRMDPIGADGYQFINQLAVDPNDNDVMYVPAGKFLWRNDSLSSIQLTNEYDSISKGWFMLSDSANYASAVLTSVTVSQNPAHTVYVGTSNRKVYRIDNANQGDPSFNDISTLYFPGGANVGNIAVDPSNADRAIVVFTNYNIYSLWCTSDGGQNWEKCAGNLEQNNAGGGNGPSLRWAEILPVGNDTLYLVASSTGLYATHRLNGVSTVWTQVGENTIGNVVCEMVRVREEDGLIVVGTHGNGIYSTKISSIQDILDIPENSRISEKRLSAYPNPAKDILNLSGVEGYSIALYSNHGEKVFQTDSKKDNCQINTKRFSAGVYYLSITKENESITKKIIISK
jgi:photosystem II stability/assembly factor-like uncharacterized protein